MARLNEPPPSLDSVEALKRRFIRQNREIARVNSTQSQRIRNLETEISRLLGENIELREQAISAAQKAKKTRSSCNRCQQLKGLKENLEGKLADIHAIVGGLTVLDRERKSISPHRRKSSIFRFPGQETVALGGAVKPVKQPTEGFLPAIVEGKRYPRQTLSTEDLKASANAETPSESPDLGPPPVTHFDVDDVSKFEPQVPVSQDHEEVAPAPLHSNLERRRKRRASSLLDTSPKGSSGLDGSSVTMRITAGAKRKLSARECDGGSQVAAGSRSEDFSYQRTRHGLSLSKAAEKSQGVSQPSTSIQRRLEESPRKALQPKDANSPRKPMKAATSEKSISYKEETAQQQKRGKMPVDPKLILDNIEPGRGQSVRKLKTTHPQEVSDVPLTLPPTTPAGADVFSPLSTEPSAARTSPPAPELQPTTSVEDVISASTRPSRRPKGAISYTEPSLRDKMRRPTKELVPAIVENSRPQQRTLSVKPESDGDLTIAGENETKDGAANLKMRTVVIKTENPVDVPHWENLPAARDGAVSPLMGRTSRINKDEPNKKPVEKESALNKTIAAESSTKSSAQIETGDENDLEQALNKLSIFDGPTSSPNSPSEHDKASKSSIDAAKRPSKVSRRHSTNPSGTEIQRVGHRVSGIASGRMSSQGGAITRRGDKESSRLDIPQRPSSVLASRGRKEISAQDGKLGRSESVKDMIGKSEERSNNETGETVRRVGERTMSRRRSMMI
ncbi:MAG: hypothetical protein Q9227_003977 [Pyrenula ochraceoflavens]